MDSLNAHEAAQRSLESAKPRATAVLQFLRKEVLAAAADGQFRIEVSVSDALLYDAVFQHLVLDALRQDGVAASFAHGTFALDWSK